MSLTPSPSAEACNQSLIYVSAGNSVVTSSVVISEYEYGASSYVLIYGTHNSILWDHISTRCNVATDSRIINIER